MERKDEVILITSLAKMITQTKGPLYVVETTWTVEFFSL